MNLPLTAVSRFSQPRALRAVRLEDCIPERIQGGWMLRLDILYNIAWSYIDTVIDLGILMKVFGAKKIARKIRLLKRAFDQERRIGVDRQSLEDEETNAEQFQDMFENDFRLLFNGLEFEASKVGLTGDRRTFLVAVQQAMTVLDVIRMFVRECDREVRSRGYYCEDEFYMSDHVRPLYELVPRFAGADYTGNTEVRRVSSGILLKRIKGIEFRLVN